MLPAAFNWVDWLIVGGLLLSVLLGLWRGLVREVLALAGWIAGIALALRHASEVGAAVPLDAPLPVRIALAGAGIVIATVVAAAVVIWLLYRLLTAARLSGIDRSLGALFGLLRGALIVLLAVLFAGGTEMARQPAWRGSVLLPHFEAALRFAAPLMPALPALTSARPA